MGPAPDWVGKWMSENLPEIRVFIASNRILRKERQRMTFDMDAFKRVFEALEMEKILEFYSPDLDHIEIDQDAPPKSPRKSDRDAIRKAFEWVARAGIKLSIENPVVGSDSAACTIILTFPDKRRLVSNTIYDIRNGKIIRQRDVSVTDPE